MKGKEAPAKRGVKLMMGPTAETMMVRAVLMLRYHKTMMVRVVLMLRYHKLPMQMSIVLSMANNMVDVLKLKVGSNFRRCTPRAPAPTVLKMIKWH